MSRFWSNAADSEEESEGSQFTESEPESGDEGEKRGTGYFLKGYVSSDSEEEQRTVKTSKEKHFDILKTTSDSIASAVEEKNWVTVLDEFNKLIDQIAKARSVIKKNGMPAYVVKALNDVKEFQEMGSAMTKSEKRAMQKADAKALNMLKQRVSKALKDYEKELAKFAELMAKKEGADDDDESDDETETIVIESRAEPLEQASFYDMPSPARAGKDAKEVAKLDQLTEILARRGKRGDKNEQIRQLTALLETASSVEREITIWFHVISAIFDTTSISGQMTAHFWRQLWKALSSVVSLLEQNPKLRLEQASEQLSGSALSVELGSSSDNTVTVVGNMLVLLERLDEELLKTLKLVDPHSEKFVSRMRDIRLVERLAEDMGAYYKRIGDKASAARVAIIRMGHLYVKHEWVRELQYKAYVKELEESRARQVAEKEARAAGIELEMTNDDRVAAEDDETELEEADADDEEADEDEDEEDKQARELRRIEEKIRKQTERAKPKDKPTVPDKRVLEPTPRPFQKGDELLSGLANFVFKNGDERQKTHALLFLVTNHALNDRFFEARDLLLMSHLQDAVHHMDMHTQILYNRATVQVGLCAFRLGHFHEAHSCLAEISSGGKTKELLAQGNSARTMDRTPEMERLDRIRQVPFHIHINLDQVECAHLVSAMLLEVPNMAAGANRKVISRPYRKLVDFFDRQHLSGPPESTRETVLAAGRALQRGDWKQSQEFVLKLKGWKLMPKAEEVQARVLQKLKEEALHTHLLTYSGCYSSLKQDDLAACYELDKTTVHKVVCRMMISEELRAAWDQPTESIVMHELEPSKLQSLALQYADKVALLVENNERALDGRGSKGDGKYGGQHSSSQGKWQGDRSRQKAPRQDNQKNRR